MDEKYSSAIILLSPCVQILFYVNHLARYCNENGNLDMMCKHIIWLVHGGKAAAIRK